VAADLEEWAEDGGPEPVEVRLLRDSIRRLERKLERKRAGETVLLDMIEQVWGEPPELHVPRPKRSRKTKREEIACLHVSDTQIGKTTDSYSVQVARERLMLLAEKVIQIATMRRTAAKVDELRIYLGGDMVEGQDIFIGQGQEIELDVLDQSTKEGPEMLAAMTLRLASEFPDVRLVCVPGNHGRIVPKSRGSYINPNWDRCLYRVLDLMLQTTDAEIPVEVAESFWSVDRVFDWGNLLVHGDQITGGFAGFPWYGTAKKAWGWIDTIPDPWDFLWFGHFHTYASAVLNHRHFLANGTTESGNEYAAANLAACGHPCQRLSFFDAEHGLIADHQVFLSDDRAPSSARAS
jgi:hypothetical protein